MARGDLAVAPGEILSLAGPPGSGKSALLHSMLPESNNGDGALLVDARGRVFPRRGPAAFRRGLSGLRAGIKKAPRLLLLDQPMRLFNGGDGRDAVRRMLAGFPGSVVMTTSNLDDASIADRIAVVDAGAIAQTGTREEIFDRPRTRFVAAAAGTNFFTALARSGKLLIGHSTISAPTSLDGRVLVTLPPGAVAVYADSRHEADPHAANVFGARIVRLGPDTVGLSPVDPDQGLELDAAADPPSGWRLGEHVYARVDVDRITAYPF